MLYDRSGYCILGQDAVKLRIMYEWSGCCMNGQDVVRQVRMLYDRSGCCIIGQDVGILEFNNRRRPISFNEINELYY